MTSALRLRADAELLVALAAAAPERVAFDVLPSAARPEFVAALACITAGSARYPAQHESRVLVHVALPERYPFQAPVATVRTPIFHPNVFPSGVICLGTRWVAAEGLDIFVQRLLRLVTFDPLLVNTTSPANAAAASWYERAPPGTPRRLPDGPPGRRPSWPSGCCARARPAAAICACRAGAAARCTALPAVRTSRPAPDALVERPPELPLQPLRPAQRPRRRADRPAERRRRGPVGHRATRRA